jgi:hypothetical protein
MFVFVLCSVSLFCLFFSCVSCYLFVLIAMFRPRPECFSVGMLVVLHLLIDSIGVMRMRKFTGLRLTLLFVFFLVVFFFFFYCLLCVSLYLFHIVYSL